VSAAQNQRPDWFGLLVPAFALAVLLWWMIH
jgi:hypothetical protein